MGDTPLYEILRYAIIMNENQLMVLSDSIWQDCPHTGIITGAYIVFYQGGPIDNCTHVTRPFSQYSAEIEYNTSCTKGMDLAYFRLLNNELLHKDLDVVPEQALLNILDKNQPYECLRMVMTPNIPDTFPE